MSRDPTVAAVASLKAAYVDLHSGDPAWPPPCTSATCLKLATRRVFWPCAPGEEYPTYCEDCASWARVVLETLGVQYRDEPLPAAPDQSPIRALMAPKGVAV